MDAKDTLPDWHKIFFIKFAKESRDNAVSNRSSI